MLFGCMAMGAELFSCEISSTYMIPVDVARVKTSRLSAYASILLVIGSVRFLTPPPRSGVLSLLRGCRL